MEKTTEELEPWDPEEGLAPWVTEEEALEPWVPEELEPWVPKELEPVPDLSAKDVSNLPTSSAPTFVSPDPSEVEDSPTKLDPCQYAHNEEEVFPENIDRILKANKLLRPSVNDDDKSQREFVVVSIFGSADNFASLRKHRKLKRYNLPFQLILSAFGTRATDYSPPSPSSDVGDEEDKQVEEDEPVAVEPVAAPSVETPLKNSKRPSSFSFSDTTLEERYGEPVIPPEQAAEDAKIAAEAAKVNRRKKKKVIDDNIECQIDGFYNEEEDVVFLHLVGAYDLKELRDSCENLRLSMMNPAKPDRRFLSTWLKLKTKFSQSLLLLFSLSHIMIMSCENSNFDTNLIPIFKAIESVRELIKPHIRALLEKVYNIPRNWVEHSRLCSPRFLLFVESDSEIPVTNEFTRVHPEDTEKMSENELFAYDVFQVLRKCRVTTNNSVHSLFHIPDAQDFVFFHDKSKLDMYQNTKENILSNIVDDFCSAFHEEKESDLLPEEPKEYISDDIDLEEEDDEMEIDDEDETEDNEGETGAETAEGLSEEFPELEAEFSELLNESINPSYSDMLEESLEEKDEDDSELTEITRDKDEDAEIVEEADAVGEEGDEVQEEDDDELPISNQHVFFTHEQVVAERSPEYEFQGFLDRQIQAIRDDSKKNNEIENSTDLIVLPIWREWFEAYEFLYNYLVDGNHDDRRALQDRSQLEKYIYLDKQFVDKECRAQFVKIKTNVYMKGIPEFYTEAVHIARFKAAEEALLAISTSYAIDRWIEKMEAETEKYWKNGHQQCETKSLLGHECANQLHRILPEDHVESLPYPDMPESLPELTHSATVRPTSYCNCGRRSLNRDEPFTIREANYEYYKRASKDCCDQLDCWDFPVFDPEAHEEDGVSLCQMLDILRNKKVDGDIDLANPMMDLDPHSRNRSDSSCVDLGGFRQEQKHGHSLHEGGESQSTLSGRSKRSSGSSSNDSESDDDNEEENENEGIKDLTLTLSAERDTLEVETEDDGKVILVESRKSESEVDDSEAPKKEKESPRRRTSSQDKTLIAEFSSLNVTSESTLKLSTQFLPGMFHSKSPPGLLPLFPSWSLVCLGHSRIYTHANGVQHQPGFLNNANFLLPWDAKVRVTSHSSHTRKIPKLFQLNKFPGERKKATKITHKKTIHEELNVKVFIGLEYECKRGHRFFGEHPGEALLHHSVDVLYRKEAAKKVATNQMPLYIKCPCNFARDTYAQLQRIHVVTPKAPVYVTMAPRVIPAPLPCPVFVPGQKTPIRLEPSSYWVLRLPYCYVGDETPYPPPLEISESNGKLLRGLCTVIAMNPEETKAWKAATAGQLHPSSSSSSTNIPKPISNN